MTDPNPSPAALDDSIEVSFVDLIMQEAFKDKEARDFPVSLGVEVTNFCNLRCPMCPREIAGRGYGKIDWDLFTKIADQAAGKRLVFLPQGFGESLIHPEFPKMLAYLSKVGVRATMVVTNATYLTENNINLIMDAQTPFLNISLDGTDKEVYESIRVNANYEKVVENVERLFRMREARNSKLPYIILRMIRMDKTEADVEAFKAKWKPFLRNGDEVAFSAYQTWSNSVEDKRVDEPEG